MEGGGGDCPQESIVFPRLYSFNGLALESWLFVFIIVLSLYILVVWPVKLHQHHFRKCKWEKIVMNHPSKIVLVEAIFSCQGTSRLQCLILWPLYFCSFLSLLWFSSLTNVAYVGIIPNHWMFVRREREIQAKTWSNRLDKGLRWWQGWEQKPGSYCFLIPITKLWDCIK